AMRVNAQEYGSVVTRIRMAVVALLDDSVGAGLTVVSSVLPAIKVPQLPLDSFFEWESVPLFEGSEPPAIKKLKGLSQQHGEYFTDAGIAYPPDLTNYDPELATVVSPLCNAQIE
ncbi:unnamed protein product, partial [Prorocentrum cordatum]